MESIQKTIKAACEDMGNEVTFRNSYSGRGMYGRECVGITGTMADCQRVVAAAIGSMTQDLFDTAFNCTDGEEDMAHALNDSVQEAIDQLVNFSWDSMGHDVIVYWPNIEPMSAEELSASDRLPTDDEFDAMNEHQLLQWAAQHAATHVSDTDDFETLAAIRASVKVIRDRIREDMLTTE